MRKSMLSRKSYCLAPAHGVRTQKEAMSILQADASISDELKKEIVKDGVVIYEKA